MRDVFDWVVRLEPEVIVSLVSGFLARMGLDKYVRWICRRTSPGQ